MRRKRSAILRGRSPSIRATRIAVEGEERDSINSINDIRGRRHDGAAEADSCSSSTTYQSRLECSSATITSFIQSKKEEREGESADDAKDRA